MTKINLNEIYSDQYLGLSEINNDCPDCFYHYTNADALHGILSNEEIWATDYRFTNDSTEFTHGIDIFQSIITSLEDSSIESDSGFSKYTMNLLSRLNTNNFIGVISKALNSLKKEYLLDNDYFDESVDDEYRKMFVDRSRYYIGLVSRICGDTPAQASLQVYDIRRFQGISAF